MIDIASPIVASVLESTGISFSTREDHGNDLQTSIAPEILPMAPAAEASAEDLSLSLDQLLLYSTSQDNAVHTDHAQKPNNGGLAGTARPLREFGASRRPKVDFEVFATQTRLQKYHENRLRTLRKRQRSLQTSIALSARLHRVGSVVHDGLVEISRHGDKAGFVQVYHTIQDLKDAFYLQWKRNIQAFDPVMDQASHGHLEDPELFSFMGKLSGKSRATLLQLIHLLRTNSSFLADCLMPLSQLQLSALCNSPKYPEPQESILPSASRGRNSASQHKRNVAFSNGLKDCAISLERSNPISLLLFNIYGISQDPGSDEYNLRLDVWSSVCAELFAKSDHDYHTVLKEVLNAFASLHEWRAKQKLELFLMDLLQRGAFLLEMIEHPNIPQDFETGFFDPLGTPEAERFFDQAVQELFEILNDPDGGLPYGALHFGSAVLGKLENAGDQSRFRGYLFFQWFFCEFLRTSMNCPEVSHARPCPYYC